MLEREYIVTLHDHQDLQSFYEDMETAGGNLYIPHRAVMVFDRRPVSRNTHYMLTDHEVMVLKNDPRVLTVELSLAEQGLELRPCWTQTSSGWNKSNSVSASYKNWGLLRCVQGYQTASWGYDGITTVAGSVNVTASGKNVDVVIVDGHMNPAHPEFAVNIDGTGGSRVVQYNWFELTPTVTGAAAGTYQYAPYVDSTYADSNGDGYSDRTTENDHGTHVAGIAAGNTQGWAHDANIYNINPYASAPSATGYFIDYLKIWHQTKSVNPTTGIRNPTITNHSYGVETKTSITDISTVNYRGTIFTGPFTASQLLGWGIYNALGYAVTTVRNTAIEADLIDLMAAGVTVIGAAGNNYSKIANYSTVATDDYNNYYAVGATRTYYLRGTISAVPGAICVGSVGSGIDDAKSSFSNCGSRIDLFAPGRHIMSSINSTIGIYSNDSRNTSYTLTKKSGTSMASPQVTGVIACLAETWPTIKPAQAVTYIQAKAKTGQITAGGLGPTDFIDLQGAANRFLYFYKERLDQGQIGPKTNQGNRPISGLAWPRPKIYRYGAVATTPAATYSVTPASSSVNEGTSLTFNVAGSNITNGTYYWTINNISTANADFGAVSGSFTIISNAGSFSIATTADLTTEGAETFTVSLRTVSTSGSVVATSSTVTVNDTSTTPAAIAPGAPTIGTATATGTTTATVTYTAPVSNGGAAITSYTATSSPGGIIGTVSQAGSGTITVSGLSASTNYTFTVTATNSVGGSAASGQSNSITTQSAASPGGTTFVFQNAGFNYSVDTYGGTFPTLTLARGQTYTFNLNGITSSHPWALRLASGNAAAVPGTTGNNASSGVYGPATVTYSVPADAPSTIYYQCVFHSGMIGSISIIN